MNAVLALTAGGPTVGMINVLLVFVLLLAAILLIIAFFLIRSSRRTSNKYAYEQQTLLPHLQENPYQDAKEQQSLLSPEKKQELQEWGHTEEGQLKQCPFCGTEVLPGGIFCLYCGQRLPIPGQAASSPIEQASADIWGQPTQMPFSLALDDMHGGAIEEHPTPIEDVAVVAAPEKQEAEEPPVQIEDVKTVPVERLEKRKEEIEEQEPGSVERGPAGDHKGSPYHTRQEPASKYGRGEDKSTPTSAEETVEEEVVEAEEEQQPIEHTEEETVEEEVAEPKKQGEEQAEAEEEKEEKEQSVAEQESGPVERGPEEQEPGSASPAPILKQEPGPSMSAPIAAEETVEEEVAEQERQEEQPAEAEEERLATAEEEEREEKQAITSTTEENVEEEVAEQERQEEAKGDEEEKEQEESQQKREEEQPARIEGMTTTQEAKEQEGEEQPAPPSEKIQEEQDESQKMWIEEQPTIIEIPAVTVENQEEPAEVSMVEQSGYLILRKLNGKPVREYPLNRPAITIGRARDNDIVIPRDKLTSRHHATVRYEHGHYALYDENSANGTFINGEEIEAGTPYILHDADSIGVGAYEFTYRTASALMKEVDHLPTAKVSTVAIDDTAEHGPPNAFAVQEEKTAVVEEEEVEKESVGEEDEEDEEEKPNEITGRKKAVIVTEVQYSSPLALEADETLLEPLRFTAYHPQEVAVESWNTLLVYAYVESALQAVYQDVNLLLREMGSGVHRASGSLVDGAPPLLPPGTNITVVPECRGVLFNPRRVTLQWSEDWHRAIFRFSARREMAGLSRTGRINVFVGPLLVGTLRMAMIFEEQERIDPLLLEDAAITVKPYRRIYTSYSHYDQNVMHASQEMYRVLGLNSLLKIDQLRSNQVLSETVRAGIEQAEVFQLFWSQQTAKSAFVRQEWEYALQLNRGEGFMRPVYWEVPLVKPPDTLTPFNFSYLPTYAFASS